MLGKNIKKIIEGVQVKMEESYNAFTTDMSTLRTSKTNASLLDAVTVKAYGGNSKINQVANVTMQKKSLLVSVWDPSLVSEVKKAIQNSSLGLNPSAENNTLLVPIPELTEERRKEIATTAAEYSERAKISVRNVRRNTISQLKDLEKAGEVSEDEMRSSIEKINALHGTMETKIGRTLKSKENDIYNF